MTGMTFDILLEQIRRVFEDNLGIMSTHNMFLWRNNENYPVIILKYPPYLKFYN